MIGNTGFPLVSHLRKQKDQHKKIISVYNFSFTRNNIAVLEELKSMEQAPRNERLKKAKQELYQRRRERQFKEMEQRHEADDKRLEEERKNHGFTQVYPPGWKRVRELAKGNAGAASLYTLFAEHIDASVGAVICDQQFLADQLEVSTRTIRNWLKYLEEQNAVLRIRIASGVCAYALNPAEVWKGYNTSKDYAAFKTKTLVNKDGEIIRRLTAMFGNPEKTETEEWEAAGQQRLCD